MSHKILIASLFLLALKLSCVEPDRVVVLPPAAMASKIISVMDKEGYREALSLVRALHAHDQYSQSTASGLEMTARNLLTTLRDPRSARDEQVIVATEISRKLLSSNAYRESLDSVALREAYARGAQLAGELVGVLDKIGAVVFPREELQHGDRTLLPAEAPEAPEYAGLHGSFLRSGITSVSRILRHSLTILLENGIVQAQTIFTDALVRAGMTKEQATELLLQDSM